MKLLVLGGTRFLGRHVVDAALARGHDVTIFTRGRLPVPWEHGVQALAGDRDPLKAPGLDALRTGSWDAVVDCSGYVPRVVEAGARLLAGRVSRYVFVSSMSVYAKTERPYQDETTPVAVLADPATEEVMQHYGALKAACESTLERLLGPRVTQVRPGLIVGPFDGSDRFGYWVARFMHPRLLGERPDRAVVPAPAHRPVQLIDGRDLAAWIVALAARDVPGTFNACSPADQWSMGDLIAALVSAAGPPQGANCAPAGGSAAAKPQAWGDHGPPPQAAWIDESVLVANGVEPWVGLPLWLPPSDPDSAGFMSMDCSRAQSAGLAVRPLVRTIADTADWLAARDNADAWTHVMSAQQERRVLEAAHHS